MSEALWNALQEELFRARQGLSDATDQIKEAHDRAVRADDLVSALRTKAGEPRTKKEKPMTCPKGYAYYVAENGHRSPATMIFQAAVNELHRTGAIGPFTDVTTDSDDQGVDGVFGPQTDKVARAVQDALGLKADGKVGRGTWGAMTPNLGAWRPPLRWRLLTLMDTYENGSTRNGFNAYNVVPAEGWYNFGVFNVNRYSAATIIKMGSQPELADQIEIDPRAVADWFGSKEGRDLQMNRYFNRELLKPAVKHLCRMFDDFPLNPGDELPDTMQPFQERLLAQAIDIVVNSGAGGYFPHKTPRQWDGGELPWASDRLPPKEEAKKIFAEEFGVDELSDYEYVKSSNKSVPYSTALKRCLGSLCESQEQRISLIAELQSRCIISLWRDEIIKRRRATAWDDGHAFQGTHYDHSQFGIGIPTT